MTQGNEGGKGPGPTPAPAPDPLPYPNPVPEPVLVLALGNLLRRDDGLGIHALETLAAGWQMPPGVAWLDGGTAGLALLGSLWGVRHLVVLDALAGGRPPGTLGRLAAGEVPVPPGGHLSPHRDALPELLAAAALAGIGPQTVAVLGIEPGDLGDGPGLSPPVAAALPGLVAAVLAELAALGYPATPRRLALIDASGHLPHISAPDAVVAAMKAFGV